MNRSEIYSGEQGRTFDQLWQWKDILASLGGVETSLSGSTNTVVSGLAASQASPASLVINLGAGWIYQQSAMDGTAYGSLPSDSTIVQQQGFAVAQTVTLTTAALSAGQSQWALIQAQFAQQDVIRAGDPTGGLLYYFNSANPTVPFQGPNGNGQTQATERQALVSISVVYGSPASTGSEVPPNATSGWVPLYLVDLAFGQTQVINAQILTAGPSVGTGVPSNYPYAPFMAGLLKQHHLGTGNGQAPQIDLTSEVKNTLPLPRLPASDTAGGLPVMKLFAGNPNGNVAGNANVNGASDFAYDTTNKILYVCTATGTTSTAVWTAVVGSTSSQFAGGTTAGSANAQTIAATVPGGYSLTPGFVITFTVGAALTNTGAATLNVVGTGAIAINKTSVGTPLTGGELVAGSFYQVIYTGTVYLLQSQALGQLATLNIGTWLKNDGSGNLTIKNGVPLGDDGAGNLTILANTVTQAMLAPGAAPLPRVGPQTTGDNLVLSNDGTSPNFVVDCSVGRVRDDSDITNMQLFAAMTKRLDQSWAAGTGNGACDTSTKGNNQTWHAYLIGKTAMTVTQVSRTSNVASLTVTAHGLGVGSTVRVIGQGGGFDGLFTVTSVTTNTFNYSNAGTNVGAVAAAATCTADGFDLLFSQSYPSPSMPSGWNTKQCLGSVMTDGSANIRPFTQVGDFFYWQSPPQDFSGTVGGTAAIIVPNGVVVEAFGQALISGVASSCSFNVYPPGLTAAPTQSAMGIAVASGNPAMDGQMRSFTNTSRQLTFVTVSCTFAWTTLGWRDPRRRLF